MNILIAVNRKYIFPAKTLIRSIAENCKDDTEIFLANNKLTDSDISELKKFAVKLPGRIKINPVYIEDATVAGLAKACNDRFPPEVFFRITALYLLPDYVEKILYLDADIIVNGDLRELYDEDVSKSCLAAVKGAANIINAQWVQSFKEKFALGAESVYISSGVLLINVKEMVKEASLEKVEEAINSYYDKLEYPDQDLLNIMFQGKMKILTDCRCNYWLWHKNADFKLPKNVNPLVYHYIGPIKPWHWYYENIHADEFWKYVKKNGEYGKYFSARLKKAKDRAGGRLKGLFRH